MADEKGVMQIFAVACLAVCLQSEGRQDPRPPVASSRDLVVASGFTGRPLGSTLGLGSGGFGGEARRAPPQAEVVGWTSPGGALVRVGPAGVKVDLPSKRELLVDPKGRVHLRADQVSTLPAPHGLDLVLADGSRVSIRPEPGGRGGLRSVYVETSETGPGKLLWQSSRRIRNAAHRRDPRGHRHALALWVLGEGDLLYRVERRGPLLLCERTLCPSRLERTAPLERVVALGDPLAASLRELSKRMPRQSTEYPDGPRVAAFLARIASRIFRPGVQRQPTGSVGAPIVPLEAAGDLRLELADGPNGMLFLRIAAPHAPMPLVEWTIGHSAQLHLVRRDGGEEGTPRYFQRGVPVEVPK